MTNLADMLAGETTPVDQSAIKGEKGTGYEARGKKGNFECRNCNYFDADDGNSCGQKTMVKLSQLQKNKKGRVIVDPRGCCEYIERKGS